MTITAVVCAPCATTAPLSPPRSPLEWLLVGAPQQVFPIRIIYNTQPIRRTHDAAPGGSSDATPITDDLLR
eukprot:SAG25_NODE_12478_length_279_cov_1.133333_1_plen_70_part_10